ncbi:MAG: hypothetical protein V4543_13710 [Bacteroidota bacterium]
MAVDFNISACKTATRVDTFGICDDPPPAESPAYLDFTDSHKWIARIHNRERKEITFIAVDHCIPVFRPNGEKESRCDGMLQFDSTIAFIELKDRNSKGWLGDAIGQLQITIDVYKQAHGLASFTERYAIVSNKQRPIFKAAGPALAQKFENDIGFLLRVKHVIDLQEL